jgi:hypothetical protein
VQIQSTKNELQNILSGKGKVSHGTTIQSIADYLGRSKASSGISQTLQQNKQKEGFALLNYIEKSQLWVKDLDFSQFIAQGAEQRVFIKDEKTVYKLNDSIYYVSWIDYFHNLLLNNYFFPDTAYQLAGFYLQENILYAVVTQNFVKATEPTNLKVVAAFMKNNGFENTRNHDYYHPQLGIILEDLHDENVLTNQGILYFIDTVFYIKPQIFWLK